MIPTGDTTGHAVGDWAHNQAAYIGGNHLLMLLVLTHHAFIKARNPEQAPVGQVLSAYSGVTALSAWTGLSPSTVKRLLISLQTEHGYLRRFARAADGQPGTAPRVIRLYWTGEDDAVRAAVRSGRLTLPKEFKQVSDPGLNVVPFPVTRGPR